jgi:zinc finger protein
MACGESGTTRMILTKIPFFREVIVSSFECDSCGWTNNEVQFGGEIKERGCRFELKVRLRNWGGEGKARHEEV